ncbi:MAG: protease modulator HflK [Pseudomonadota bacterium]
MSFRPAWWPRFDIMRNDGKGPWGGRSGGGDDGAGGGSGSDGGPRNPWAMPPGGRRGKPGPSALDEFLKRARGSGGGGSGFGGGLPGGMAPRSLWLIGVGVILLAWIAFTTVHPIGPQQRGVVSLFGRYSGTLEPGIGFTLPAPFNTVTKVDVQNIQTEEFPGGGGDNLMLTGDQNIVDLAYSVRWDISNPQDYLFQLAQPKDTVRATAESAMRQAVASVTLDQAIGNGRNAIEANVQNLMQQILDDYRSGIRVQGVAISRADPPAAVNDDFKAVSAAQQEAVSNLNNSRSYAQQVIAKAQGESAQFDRIYDQYKLAPAVTRRRMYYETMEAVLARTDKTIVEAPGVVPYLGVPNAGAKATPPPVLAQPGAPQ